MTFKTKLSKALDIRGSTIVADNYEVEDGMLSWKYRDGFVDPHDPRNAVVFTLDLTNYDYGEYTFYDQEVEVDDGYFVASDDEGEDFVFKVTVQRPITEADL